MVSCSCAVDKQGSVDATDGRCKLYPSLSSLLEIGWINANNWKKKIWISDLIIGLYLVSRVGFGPKVNHNRLQQHEESQEEKSSSVF